MADSRCSADSPSRPVSNRQFGIVFVVFFAILGLLGLWRGWRVTPWFFGASALVVAVTFIAPSLLTPFNRWWMPPAAFLHKVVSPIVLG